VLRDPRESVSWVIFGLILALELLTNHIHEEQTIYCLYGVICLLLGCLLKLPSHKDALLVYGIYFNIVWIAVLFPEQSSFFWGILILMLACVLFGLYQRPRIRSEKLGGNVGVAFYYGTNCPWIARIASLIGLPARNLAPIMYGKAMVPTGKGYIERREAAALKGWVVLDTGKKPTPMMVLYFNQLNGKSIDKLGCTKAMKRIIEEIGFIPALTPGGCMRSLLECR